MAGRRELMYNFRGVYGRELTHSVAYLAGRQAAAYYAEVSGKGDPKVIVGNDHRFSSNSLKHYLIQGLVSGGVVVRDVGLLPTSVLAFAVKKAADGGCMVTASHNPPEYNGLKFFDSTGGVMKPATEDVILAKVVKETAAGATVQHVGSVTKNYGIVPTVSVINDYTKAVVGRVEVPVPLNVGLDCRFGTAFVIMPFLLKSLCCTYYPIHNELNPYFLKSDGEYLSPEPTEANIAEIAGLVRCGALDLGLVYDGDSDRNVVIDNKGEFIKDDIILLLLALEYSGDRRCVITVDTSLMVERHLRDQGFELTVTPVGDPFVSSALAEGKGSFGGVPNGHYIFPDFTPYSDGIYSSAVVLQIASKLKTREMKLSDRIAELPPTHIRKTKVRFQRPQAEFEEDVAPALRDLMASYTDALDFRATDDTVVTGRSDDLKLLVRYNRWDNNFNVQAESLVSAAKADELLGVLVEFLEARSDRA